MKAYGIWAEFDCVTPLFKVKTHMEIILQNTKLCSKVLIVTEFINTPPVLHTVQIDRKTPLRQKNALERLYKAKCLIC